MKQNRSGEAETRRNPNATRWRGAIGGILAALAGLAAGSVAAGILGTSQTPVVAIGSAFIDRVPPWLKDLAISWFGTHDKDALRVGIFIVVIALAAIGGILAVRRYWAGALIIVVLTGVAVVAALTRRGLGADRVRPVGGRRDHGVDHSADLQQATRAVDRLPR